MSDYIKREDAIKTLEQLKDNEEGSLWDEGVDACINDIKRHVPSVELPTKCIAEIKFDDDKLHEIVDDMLTRCKDCKYWKSNTEFCEFWSAMNVAQRTCKNDFCSYGKRKDGEEE